MVSDWTAERINESQRRAPAPGCRRAGASHALPFWLSSRRQPTGSISAPLASVQRGCRGGPARPRVNSLWLVAFRRSCLRPRTTADLSEHHRAASGPVRLVVAGSGSTWMRGVALPNP